MKKKIEGERLLKEIEKVKLPTFKKIMEGCMKPHNDFISTLSKNPGCCLTETGEKIRGEINKYLMPIDHKKFANLVFERHSNFSTEDYTQKINFEGYLETASYLFLGQIKDSYTKGIKEIESSRIKGEKDQNNRLLYLSLIMAIGHYTESIKQNYLEKKVNNSSYITLNND